ncbi:MAG TPA: cytochrome c biogenesis protein CcsA [Rhizobacter sp.]|nr:cytochrome c biogenesis protein CcsA [Rhizobacter sp.]
MILSLGSSSAFNTPATMALWVPTVVAWVGYAAAALPGDENATWPRRALLIGWLAHAVAIFIDMAGIGSPLPGARFGFAPALSATLWLVLAVYAVESRWVPLPGVRRTLAALGVVAVMLAALFPGEFRPQATSPWAPLHWALGIASYGLFGAAVLHAAMLDAAERRMRVKGQASAPPAAGVPLLRLERLTFQFVSAGFALLSATLLLGWWHANPWRWDHKTVFSVLGWLVFAALLMGRQTLGWRGRRAIRGLYVGAALLLLAYVGSRFVLEVVLQRAAI